jgi:hypothetical protein
MAYLTGRGVWTRSRYREAAREASINLSVDGSGATNVALHRPTTVSSVVGDNEGSRAVNGHKDGVQVGTHATHTHTHTHTPPSLPIGNMTHHSAYICIYI